MTENQLCYFTKNNARLLLTNEACRTCPWFRQCLGGCRLQAKLYTGSFYGPDPTRCEFFKNGFRQKIIGLGDSLGWKRVPRGE